MSKLVVNRIFSCDEFKISQGYFKSLLSSNYKNNNNETNNTTNRK